MTIAIDGPAGSGKSTICERLAQTYGYIFVDTGAFYRAIAYRVSQAALSLEDEAGIAALLAGLQLQFIPDAANGYRLLANGQDITDHLRSSAVEAIVSPVAKMPLVRAGLLPLQRAVAAQGKIILAGRDIGTVVLPDADLKLYLDATLEERAKRRYLQMLESGRTAELATVQADLAQRDKTDSERASAPLTQAEDAIYILTDGKSIEEVVAEIGQYINKQVV
jgi:cytidylate kinase